MRERAAVGKKNFKGVSLYFWLAPRSEEERGEESANFAAFALYS